MSCQGSVISPQPATLSRLNRHFASCATFAATIAVFGLINKSDAAIVTYTKNTDLSGSLYINLETGVTGVTPDAVPGWDIALDDGPVAEGLDVQKLTSSNVVVTLFSGIYSVADKLNSGVTVDANSKFALQSINASYPLVDNYYGLGVWVGGATGKFLGVRFTASDGAFHYAWVRLDVGASNTFVIPATLVDWSYEDVADTGIVTGQTAAAVPEPSSAAALGVLALGAAGVRSRRRKAS